MLPPPKLDRLSRKMVLIAAIMDDKKVKLRVASMQHADKVQLHIHGALAEQGRDFISKRTKAALAAAKARRGATNFPRMVVADCQRQAAKEGNHVQGPAGTGHRRPRLSKRIVSLPLITVHSRCSDTSLTG